ncbi:hypothetical protein [Methylomonas koyamae]|uniref:hypothetical protein n=1 Tax=Methylomonas koyamae TaxID=702114 RepID=UPI0006CF9CE8|nr:hypothetical protein [Methylomonas koyamae]
MLAADAGNAAQPATAIKAVSRADIQQRVQSVKDKQNLAEDVKNRILAAYRESEDNLSEAEAQDAQAESFKQALNLYPVVAKQIAGQITERKTA